MANVISPCQVTTLSCVHLTHSAPSDSHFGFTYRRPSWLLSSRMHACSPPTSPASSIVPDPPTQRAHPPSCHFANCQYCPNTPCSQDATNNIPTLGPQWISAASLWQRRGRAGRVRPGKAFHLLPRVMAQQLVPDFEVSSLWWCCRCLSKEWMMEWVLHSAAEWLGPRLFQP